MRQDLVDKRMAQDGGPFVDVQGRRDALLAGLRELSKVRDAESAHGDADALILAYFAGDAEILEAWGNIRKWYA